MLKKYSIGIFLGTVIGLPALAFLAIRRLEISNPRLPVYAGKDQRLIDFKMINHRGNTITLQNWKGKIVVVDFFFTHCLSVCPRMTGHLQEVQSTFENDKDILINSFTVDPERDSVEQLRSYADRFGIRSENWNLLTGDKKEIYRLARKSFALVATDGDGRPNDFIHSDRLILMDKQGRIRGYYDGISAVEVKQLINDIKKLKDEH